MLEEIRGRTVAVSGKGGTGKTVISAIMVKLLSQREVGRILAIDADPATSLATALGVRARKTVGDIREMMYQDSLSQNPVSSPVPLDMLLENHIADILAETNKFHLLVMGRPEGPGCYCLLNDMLRYIIDKLSHNFDITVIDCEAGLEHLSRRTMRKLDFLFVVTDPTKRGLDTANSIKKLAQKMEIDVGRACLIINKASDEDEAFYQKVAGEIVGVVPIDGNITQYDRIGRPILDLPDNSPAVQAVQEILDKTLFATT